VRLKSRTRGIAVVETAIVLPLLFLLLLVVGELGRAFIQYSRLSHRVHAAARHVAENAMLDTTGVLQPPSNQLLTQARNLVIYGVPVVAGAPAVPGLNTSNVMVNFDFQEGTVQVQVTYPYQPIVGEVLPMFGFGGDIAVDAITLRPQTTLRAL
jgi:Flp pilus assembly protein TadG